MSLSGATSLRFTDLPCFSLKTEIKEICDQERVSRCTHVYPVTRHVLREKTRRSVLLRTDSRSYFCQYWCKWVSKSKVSQEVPYK